MALDEARAPRERAGDRERERREEPGVDLDEMDGQSGGHPPFNPTINAGARFVAHPYIISQLLRLVSTSTLAAFAQCNKQACFAAIPLLYPAHLRLPNSAMAQFIKQRSGPSVTEPSAFLPSPGYTFHQVRSLHILDYDVTVPSSERAERCEHFNGISTLVIHPTAKWCARPAPDLMFLADLFANADLFIHFPHNQASTSLPAIEHIMWGQFIPARLRRPVIFLFPSEPGLRSRFVLAPRTGRSGAFRLCSSITIVLLPSELPQASNHRRWIEDFQSHLRVILVYLDTSTACPVTFVGLEYGGVRADHRPYLAVELEDELPRECSVILFSRWIELQKGRTVFSDEEEAVLRTDDRDLIGQSNSFRKTSA